MKKAFTLIELLVVIAIIAILAAILFPVFAQAKAAAKGSASLSNIKQISLAAIMYSADYDDIVVRAGVWGSSDPDALSPGTWNYATWALSIDPYQKNVGINSDPLGKPAVLANEIARRTGTRFIAYGFNYGWLNPAHYPDTPIKQIPISGTAAADPAATVYFASRPSRGNELNPAGWYMGTDTALNLGNVDVPNCDTDPDIWCMSGWGTGSLAYSEINTDLEGKSSGYNAPRASGGVVTAMLDGHVKKLQLGALAAGTNWTKTTASSAIIITDMSKFLWDTR